MSLQDIVEGTSIELVSFGARLGSLANADPAGTALIFADTSGADTAVGWAELDRWSTQTAHTLRDRGAAPGTTVVIAIPNSIEHIVCAFATWKTGACALPVSYGMPDLEFDSVLQIAQPSVVVAERGDHLRRDALGFGGDQDDTPLPDVIPHPGKAVCSGGSTGTPKIIVDPNPWAAVPGMYMGFLGQTTGLGAGDTLLIPGPLYHNLPFTLTSLGLYEGSTVVLMERFDAERCVGLIERYRVNWAGVVPTMMQRIARLDGIEARDLSSLNAIFHTASMCPAWVKRAWIDLIGAEKVFEAFAATEGIGHSVIRGDEWLAHPGSVGKPSAPVRIVAEDGTEAATGEVGEIFFKTETIGSAYVGAPEIQRTPDGYATLGDMGRVDEDGYIYIADRRVDLIISGGANIFPAEVEAALTGHPSVADAAVIGLPDAEWGSRVHAVVELAEGAHNTAGALDAHCRERLAAYKVPRTYEFIERLPRNEAGKIRRSALVQERSEKEATP